MLKVLKLRNWWGYSSDLTLSSKPCGPHPFSLPSDNTALLLVHLVLNTKYISTFLIPFFSFSQCDPVPRGEIASVAQLHECEVDPGVLRCTGEVVGPHYQ